jgi:hypothetical protein
MRERQIISSNRDELARARAMLSVWQSSSSFIEAATHLHSRTTSTVFFNRPELAFLRDAWVIAKFLKWRPHKRARLSSREEAWPDGLFESACGVVNIEVTEAFEPGRRRGEQFKPEAPRVRHDPVEDWVRRAEQIPAALEKAITDKAAKRYSSPFTLLVYLNINEWGIRRARPSKRSSA